MKAHDDNTQEAIQLGRTPEAMAAALGVACYKDAKLRKELLRQPQQVVAKTGMTLPEGFKIRTHANSDKVWHIPLPDPQAKELPPDLQLDDEDLDKVAAGEVVLGATIGGGIAAIVPGVITGVVVAASAAAILGGIGIIAYSAAAPDPKI